MTKDEALRLALEALESTGENNGYNGVTQYFDETMVDQAITAIKAALEAKDEPVARYCCHSCFQASGGVMLDRLILCSECGNKRCPKASDHNFSCTGSNEPNQWGSIYTTPPQRKPLTEIALLGAYEEEQQGRWGDHVRGLRAIEAAHGIKGQA